MNVGDHRVDTESRNWRIFGSYCYERMRNEKSASSTLSNRELSMLTVSTRPLADCVCPFTEQPCHPQRLTLVTVP